MIKSMMVFGFLLIMFSCNHRQPTKDGYNKNMSKLIFSNFTLRNKVISIFGLSDKANKVFKVIISRRDQFVRITIYELIAKEEVIEKPSSFFIFDSSTFLCYDGSELIDNIRVSDEIINDLKKHLMSSPCVIDDSRGFQFDMYNNKSIKLNNPAINPFDLTENKIPIKFPSADTYINHH